MTKNLFIRFFLYFILISVFFVSVFNKINHIKKNNKKEIPTFIGEWNKNGKPVYVKKVVPENIDIIEKITATTTDGVNLVSFVNLEIKSILTYNSTIFIELNKKDKKIKRIYAKITNISNNIDYKTGMYIVKLKLETKLSNDLAKDFYTCYIVKNKLKNVIILNNESIKKENDKSFVFLIKDENIVYKKYIELGYNDGFNQVIAKGLNFGDRVVVEGMSILKENDKIDIVKNF